MELNHNIQGHYRPFGGYHDQWQKGQPWCVLLFLQACEEEVVHAQELHGITAENLVATVPEVGQYYERQIQSLTMVHEH